MSLAICKAGAAEKDVPLYRHIADLAGNTELVLPVPVRHKLTAQHLHTVFTKRYEGNKRGDLRCFMEHKRGNKIFVPSGFAADSPPAHRLKSATVLSVKMFNLVYSNELNSFSHTY